MEPRGSVTFTCDALVLPIGVPYSWDCSGLFSVVPISRIRGIYRCKPVYGGVPAQVSPVINIWGIGGQSVGNAEDFLSMENIAWMPSAQY